MASNLHGGAPDEIGSIGLIAPTRLSPSDVICEGLKHDERIFQGATWLEKSRTGQLQNIYANLRLPRGAPVLDLGTRSSRRDT